MSKWARRFRWLAVALCCLTIGGCGKGGEEQEYSDILAETEQMPDLTEGVDTSGMLAYEYLGSQYYQGEKIQIWGERQYEGCSIYLHREDGSRELLAENVNPFEMRTGWRIDEQDRCFYRSGSGLVWIDENGKTVLTTEPEEGESLRDICQLADGRFIAVTTATFESKVWEIDTDSGKWNAIAALPLYTGVSLIAPNGDGLMLLNDGGVWDVNLSDGTLKNLISFEGTSYALKDDNYTIEGYLVKEDFRLLEDGSAELLWSDGTSEFVRQEQIEKETLVMRFAFPDSMIASWMKERIVSFNQNNEDYYIVIDEVPADADWNDFCQRTDMELAAGKGADIICGCSVYDISSLLEKGAFADLTPYMESSGVKEEDYFPAAFSGWKDGDKVYGLNCMVYMKGFWLDKVIAGDVPVSSVEDLADRMLAYEGDAVFNSGSTGTLRFFLENSESLCGMVNFESGTCDFSGELFVKLLEAAKRYGWEQSKESFLQIGGTVHYWNFFSFPDRAYWNELGKVPVGYLFDDGGHTKASMDTALAINAASEKKEGAWEFLHFLLSEEVQSSFAVDVSREWTWQNYPVNREIFDRLCKDHELYYEEGYRTVVNAGSNTEFKDMLITGMTEERKEELKEALEAAEYVPLRTQPLVQIIVEEAAAYFSGSKSIDEVRDMVQNRVQLYLNEKN